MKASIRTLRHNEAVPDVEPRRYRAGHGYIKLRWLVDTQSYVEEYEHRIAAGRPPAWMHVHHINGVKHDNRPENLQVLTPVEHARLHATEGGAEATRLRRAEKRGGGPTHREAKALRAAKRREELADRSAEMKRLYLEGKTTIEIGAAVGIHPSGVSRHLREIGVLTRPRNKATKAALPKARQVVQARAGMRCERCGVSTKWSGAQVHHRLPRGMGGSSDAAVNSPANLLNLCAPCHGWVESHRAEAFEQGWLVHQEHEPTATPVLLHEHGWVLLDDEGGSVQTLPKEVPA